MQLLCRMPGRKTVRDGTSAPKVNGQVGFCVTLRTAETGEPGSKMDRSRENGAVQLLVSQDYREIILTLSTTAT